MESIEIEVSLTEAIMLDDDPLGMVKIGFEAIRIDGVLLEEAPP